MTIRLRSISATLRWHISARDFQLQGKGFRWTSHTLLTGVQSFVPLKLAEATQISPEPVGAGSAKEVPLLPLLLCFVAEWVLSISGACSPQTAKKALKGFMERIRIVMLDF